MAEAATTAPIKSASPKKPKPTPTKPKKAPKAQRAAPLTLTEIEHLAGQPIDFNDIYTKTDEPVRKKLFAVAAAQQLRDFVNSARTSTKARPAMGDLDLAAAIQNWTPVLKRRGIGAVAKAAKVVSGMTADEKAELVKLLNG